MELILTIIFVLGVTAIISFFSFKKKNSTWKGYLSDRKMKMFTDEDGFSKEEYRLIFTTDDGKKEKLVVSKDYYNNAVMGKRYVKNKGDWNPQLEELSN